MEKINIENIEKLIINDCLELQNEHLKMMDIETAELIKKKHRGQLMVKLNPDEILFFEWLKENDFAVWNDLWEDTLSDNYIISIDFLPYLIKYKNGFPICDLLNNDNYYFVPIHLKGAEIEMLSDTLQIRLKNKESLTPAQLLLIEISLHPIDIWHFAFRHKLPIETVKIAVHQLVEDGSIVHFTDAEHLANFIDV